MITRIEYECAQERAAELLKRARIIARADEIERIDVVDLGLGELEETGLQILTMVNTDAIAVKVLVLFPNQTFAEHRHPSVGDYPGKEETVRCQWGQARLYVPGKTSLVPRGHPPAGREKRYTARHEIILRPGDQHTVPPDTWHWFQAGPEGAVVWSFSGRATDAEDEFTDPQVVRVTEIKG